MTEPLSKDALARRLAEARAIAAEQHAGRETLRAAQLDACVLRTVRELQQQLQEVYRELDLAQVQARSNAQQLQRVTQSLPWRLSWPLRVCVRQLRLWLARRRRPAGAEAQAAPLSSDAWPPTVPVPEGRPAVLLILHDDPNDDVVFDAVDMCRLLATRYTVCVWLLTPSQRATELAALAHEVLLRPAGYDDSHVAIQEIYTRHSFQFSVALGLETRPVLPALQAAHLPVVGVVPDTGRRPVSPTILHAFALGSHVTLFSSQDMLDQARQVTHLVRGLVTAHFAWAPHCTAHAVSGQSAEDSQGSDASAPWILPAGAQRLVLGCGPINDDSGLDLFIGCVAALHRQGQLPDDVHAVWVGQPDRNPDSEACLAFALGQLQRSGLQNRVSIVTQPCDDEPLLSRTVVLVLPSRRECLPAMTVQALAGGIPAVCFDSAGGVAAAWRDAGLASFCVAPYPDVAALAGLLARQLGDVTVRDACGAGARQLAGDRLGDAACLRQLGVMVQQAMDMTRQERVDLATILGSTRFAAHYVDPSCPALITREAVAGHYIRSWRTGYARRKPCAGFHPGVYQVLHSGLPGHGDPFADYLRRGEPDGPWNTPVIAVSAPRPATPTTARTALHIHAYYPDLVPEMLARLARNLTTPDIYVTVKSAADQDQVQAMLAKHPGGPHTVMVVENKGRDIGPFLSALGARLSDRYDVIGHVHTKRSPHITDRGMVDVWRHFLLENLLGGEQSGAMMDTIIAAMQTDDALGIVFPDDPTPWDWDNNVSAAQLLAGPLGVDALPEQFNFPAGTMFWIRGDVLRRFADLDLNWDDYPLEPLGPDGSMLHALERLFGVVPATLGKRCAVTWVDGVSR
ncbi:MAG: rhamnan synthesis F family protein [Burkholderiaceae bacterium]